MSVLSKIRALNELRKALRSRGTRTPDLAPRIPGVRRFAVSVLPCNWGNDYSAFMRDPRGNGKVLTAQAPGQMERALGMLGDKIEEELGLRPHQYEMVVNGR